MKQLSIFGLEGQVALVVGGGGAIGSAVGAALAGAGANVTVAGRTAESLEAAVARIRESGAEACRSSPMRRSGRMRSGWSPRRSIGSDGWTSS
jgi:NAD(P)-dependent dehydrogenase (short-subunit alcohol dehydrogenase family)